MKRLTPLFLLTFIGTLSSGAQAGGDAAAGKSIAEEKCQACHGVDGNSATAQYPRLAGQYADYLEHALLGYKDGSRSNPIMLGFAQGLSEQDIEDVSAWYASQSGLSTPKVSRTVSK